MQQRLAVHCAIMAVLICGCQPTPPATPVLTIDRLSHEFPPARDWKPTTEFSITNTGGDTLKIQRIESSCGCTTANSGKSELAVGEKTTLQVQMSRPPIGYQKATVNIFTNSNGGKPVSLEFMCWANSNQPRIVAFSPHTIRLRNQSDAEGPEIEIVTHEIAGNPLVRTAECDLPFVAVAETGSEISSLPSPEYVQRSYHFVAALMDDSPVGQFDGKVTFRMDGANDDKGPREFVLPIRVIVVPPLYAEPNTLFAAMSSSGEAPEWRVSIRRRSSAVAGKPIEASTNVEWLSAEVQGTETEDSTTDNRDPSIAGTLRVRVRSIPETTTARAEVTIKGDEPGTPDIVIPVVVTGVVGLRNDAAAR